MSIIFNIPQQNIKVQALNNFFSIDLDRGSNVETPVTLAEAKAHLVITFTDDDAYITALISQCIETIEKYTSTAIYKKNVLISADIVKEFELPYGPVASFTSASLKTGVGAYTALTLNADYEIDNSLQFPKFIPYTFGRFSLSYSVGYGLNIPAGLKLAVLNELAFRYEDRGDATNRYAAQNVGVSEGAEALANPYRRMAWV